MKVIFVAGARPNFMKIAPILREKKNMKVLIPYSFIRGSIMTRICLLRSLLI